MDGNKRYWRLFEPCGSRLVDPAFVRNRVPSRKLRYPSSLDWKGVKIYMRPRKNFQIGSWRLRGDSKRQDLEQVFRQLCCRLMNACIILIFHLRVFASGTARWPAVLMEGKYAD